MTNDELYLSFLKESNNASSRQAEVTKRLTVDRQALEDIATKLKQKGVDTASLKKQIERGAKASNLGKLTLHKNKKNEPCTIGKPKSQSGGQDKFENFKNKTFFECLDLKKRQDFVKELQKLNKELEMALKAEEKKVA